MDTPRRDANLGAEAELAAVGKLGRRIVQHDRAVDTGEEGLGDRRVLGDDRVGMVRRPAVDMRERAFKSVDDGDGQDRRKVLGRPVFFRGRCDVRQQRAAAPVAAQFAAGGFQRGRDLRQQRGGAGDIDQQRLGRPAYAGAAQLGIDDDAHRPGRIGGAIDIGMA